MKKSTVRSLMALAAITLNLDVCSAAIFADFSGLPNGDALIDTPNSMGPGYDGWTQSELSDATAPDDFAVAYGQAVNLIGGGSAPGVAVGALNQVPENDSYYIQHAVGTTLADSSTTFTFALGRIGAWDENDNPQNSFEVGAYTSGGSELFSFIMERTIDETKWNMYYRTGGGTPVHIFTTHSIHLNQVTDFTLDFVADGADADFDFTLETSVDTFNMTGTLAGLASASYDSLRVSMLKVPGTTPPDLDSYGTNYFAFTAMQVVPESSTILLGLLGAFVMIRRRR